MERPCDSHTQNSRLPEMLEDDAEVVVAYPAFGHGVSEGDAEAGIQDEHGVGDGERDRVAREHGRELEVEDVAVCLDATDICADDEEEEGYPEDSEEAAKIIRAAMLVGDIEVGLAGGEGDHGT